MLWSFVAEVERDKYGNYESEVHPNPGGVSDGDSEM